MKDETNKKIPSVPGLSKYRRNPLAKDYPKMVLSHKSLLLTLFMMLLFAEPALAHPGNNGIISFSAGLAHPWLGLDHLTVMVTIGLWSRSVQTAKAWRLPTAFLLFMVLGALLSYTVINLFWSEQGIVLSLMLLGAVLLWDKSASIRVIPPLLAVFGMCHGYAHGVEIENGHSQLAYFLGFVSSTALLQLIGFGLAGLKSVCQPRLRKSTGLFCLIVGSLSLA